MYAHDGEYGGYSDSSGTRFVQNGTWHACLSHAPPSGRGGEALLWQIKAVSDRTVLEGPLGYQLAIDASAASEVVTVQGSLPNPRPSAHPIASTSHDLRSRMPRS